MSDSRPTKNKRRWYQYSLRTLLLVMTLSAVGMSFYLYADSYKQQHEAAAALAAKGVTLEWRPVKPAWLKGLLRIFVKEEVLHDCSAVHGERCGLTDEDLRHLGKMPHIERLYLASNPIRDAGMVHVRDLKHLKRLSLWATGVTDDGLRHLAGLHSLEVLDIHNSGSGRCIGTDTRIWLFPQHSIFSLRRGRGLVSSKCLEHLTGLRNLKALKFSFPVDDDGLAILAGLPKLRIRTLILGGVTNAGLANLPRLPALETVVVEPSQFSSDGFEHFGRLPKLQRLWLEKVQIPPYAWRNFAKMTSLKELALPGTALQDDGLLYVGKLTGLERLSLRSTEVGDDGIAHLAGLTKLKELDLRDTSVTADCLEHVVAMSHLGRLGFQAPLDDDAVCWLAQLPDFRWLPGLSRDTVHEFYLTDAGLAELPSIWCLGYVRLHDARDGVGIPGIDAPEGSDTMTDAGLPNVWRTCGMRYLVLSGREITLAGFRWGKDVVYCTRVQFATSRSASEILRQPLGADPAALEIGPVSLKLSDNNRPHTVELVIGKNDCPLSLLEYLPNVQRLSIRSGNWKFDWDNLRFARNLVELATTDSGGSRVAIDAAGIRRLGELKRLRKLACGLPDGISAEDLAPLAQLEDLEELELHCGDLGAEVLGFVHELKHLRKLAIVRHP